ncbi:MAG: type II toxin-antitoxin system VapC family toxin [Thermoguttaceae bacterium]|jgi:tRNA(fMet)-specific endonuclease VapC
MEPAALLDTDILSVLMRGVPNIVGYARKYLSYHAEFTFSAITRYEILRGLKAKRASTQLAVFDVFCSKNKVLPLTDVIVVRAADIYADLYAHGQLILDADILIAATVLEHNLVLVTNNMDHFNRIPGLRINNWLI